MNFPVHPHEDEIDLVALVTTLWSEKIVITVFLVIATLLGGLYILVSKVEYEIRLDYDIDTAPPFRTGERVHTDINRKFFDEDIFSLWKESKPNSALNFKLIDDPKVIDEFAFEREVENKLIVVSPESVLVRTDNAGLVLEVASYLKFVAAKISDVYQAQATKQRALLDQLPDINSSTRILAEELTIFDRAMALEDYLENISDGAELLLISRPKEHVITSTPKRLVLAMSLIIGGVVGVMFVLVRSAFRKSSSAINQAAN